MSRWKVIQEVHPDRLADVLNEIHDKCEFPPHLMEGKAAWSTPTVNIVYYEKGNGKAKVKNAAVLSPAPVPTQTVGTTGDPTSITINTNSDVIISNDDPRVIELPEKIHNVVTGTDGVETKIKSIHTLESPLPEPLDHETQRLKQELLASQNKTKYKGKRRGPKKGWKQRAKAQKEKVVEQSQPEPQQPSQSQQQRFHQTGVSVVEEE